jgi:hypothetical protein
MCRRALPLPDALLNCQRPLLHTAAAAAAAVRKDTAAHCCCCCSLFCALLRAAFVSAAAPLYPHRPHWVCAGFVSRAAVSVCALLGLFTLWARASCAPELPWPEPHAALQKSARFCSQRGCRGDAVWAQSLQRSCALQRHAAPSNPVKRFWHAVCILVNRRQHQQQQY